PMCRAIDRAAGAAAFGSARVSAIGSTIRDSRTGAAAIPVVHRIAAPAGVPLGAVVGIVPVADFTSLFAAVPLARDAVITVLRPDGSLLARYPEEPAANATGGGTVSQTNLDAA